MPPVIEQIYINRDEIAPGGDKTLYNEVFKKLLHLGDFIGVKGFMFTTQTGELTLHEGADRAREEPPPASRGEDGRPRQRT